MLDKRVEVLFPKDVYDRLVTVARSTSTSVGQLIREAVADKYLGPDEQARQKALARIFSREDDLGNWDEVKQLLDRRYG